MSNKIERHIFNDDSTSVDTPQRQSKFKRGVIYLKNARHRVKVPKMFKKPSVVLVCKLSVKILFLAVILCLVILLFVLIFKLLSHYITKLGAILVIYFI